jgi:hypothetical protein
LDGGISALAAARHHHGRPADRVVYAGVIGIGCTIGIRKMARISHPISESELENAVNWFFSVDNINAASDRVLQLMDRLELPKLLQRTPGRSHTSSDGQKFEVRVDSLNVNHSFKYFCKEQGVSVHTFRDERDLLWHSLVFSAADRESAYVIDGSTKLSPVWEFRNHRKSFTARQLARILCILRTFVGLIPWCSIGRVQFGFGGEKARQVGQPRAISHSSDEESKH